MKEASINITFGTTDPLQKVSECLEDGVLVRDLAQSNSCPMTTLMALSCEFGYHEWMAMTNKSVIMIINLCI